MQKSLEKAIASADTDVVRSALHSLLSGALNPAFGALPKREFELLLLQALMAVGYLDAEPEIYAMIRGLRTTKAKARSLLYEIELRRRGDDDLDGLVRNALRKPLFQKQGEMFCIEIDNPLVADHVQALLKELGHTSDGSFSASLVRMNLDAAAALIERMMSESDRPEVQKALIAAGAPDKTLQGAIRGVLKAFATRIAGAVGGAFVDDLGDTLISPLLEGSIVAVRERAKLLLQGT